MGLRQRIRDRLAGTSDLEQRVAELEAQISELRRHNLRLAELADLMQQLLMPAVEGDRERLRQALDDFNSSL